MTWAVSVTVSETQHPHPLTRATYGIHANYLRGQPYGRAIR